MRFSEEEVCVMGVALALLVSALISMPLVSYMLKWYWSHPRKDSYKEMIGLIVYGVIVIPIEFYGVIILLQHASVALFLIIGSILLCAALYPFVKRTNCRYMTEYSDTFNDEENNHSAKIRNISVSYFLLFALMMPPLLSLGSEPLVKWIMPDVVEVRNGPRRACYSYKVDNYYVFPFHNGLKPGRSYIDNLSKDTVYRLVVTYGIPGEDRANHYAVKEMYPPHSLSRMAGSVIHAMDTIAPWMPPSRGRMGRYRTQRIYLTDLEHLWDFKLVDMRKYGLERNRSVESIEENRNRRALREDPNKYRMYKSIDPYPYRRLIPDSLLKSKRSGVGDNRMHGD